MEIFVKIVFLTLMFYQCSTQEIVSIVASQIEFLREICDNRTQNASIFEEIKTTIFECEEIILNGTNLDYQTLSQADSRAYYEFYRKQCRSPEMIRERNLCNEKIKALLHLCANETEMIAFGKIEKIALKLDSIICELDDDSVKTFFSPKGIECLTDNYITMGFCLLSALPEENFEKQEFFYSLISGREKECGVINSIQECVVTELELCEEQTPAQVVKLVFQFFKRQFACPTTKEYRENEIPHGDTSNSNSHSSLRRISTKYLIIILIIQYFSIFLT